MSPTSISANSVDKPLRPAHIRVTALAAVALWLAYWIIYMASGYSTEGWVGWALLWGPHFWLGLATGRWWSIALPFCLVALLPLAPDQTCMGVDCGEDAIPAWVIMVSYVGPRGALAALAGVSCRRLLSRAVRRPNSARVAGDGLRPRA